jgi:CRP-like cAMP-binding protein
VYFPIDCFASLVIEVDHHPGLEVGMVGHEGMLGAELMLHPSAVPWRTVIQGGGRALRMKTSAFLGAMTDSAGLQRTLKRYLMVRADQLALAAACERFHAISPRLARWLLMSHDRARADSFHVTHEFLAFMLGVRRVGVTVAAGKFQTQGLISYRRGELQVLDRPALENEACSCYQANLDTYDHLMR